MQQLADAMRTASANSAWFSGLVSVAEESLTEKAEAEAHAREEAKKAAAEARVRKQKEARDRRIAEARAARFGGSSIRIFGWEDSFEAWSATFGVVFAESEEDAVRKLGRKPPRLFELDYAKDVVEIGSYTE